MPARIAECRLAPEAERDLEAIWLYTFEEWGLEQAHLYTDELGAAFTQLAASPEMQLPVIRFVKAIGASG